MSDVSRPRSRVRTQSSDRHASEAVEMVILLVTVVLAVASLIWLAIATAQAHMDQVRWELWMPSKTQIRDYTWNQSLATNTAVAIATAAMLVVMGLAVLGHATGMQSNQARSQVSVASRIACVAVLPLTMTLPIQFAAFAQTRAWGVGGHAMEMVVRYGPFPAILLGFLLLTVAEIYVGVAPRRGGRA
jgi:hypothetical protein